MSAQNKKQGSKRGTKYGMDLQDLQDMKKELESEQRRDFEDEFLEGEEYLKGAVVHESDDNCANRKKIFKRIVATVSAVAMIIGSITVGIVLGSTMDQRKGGKSDD